MLNIGVAGPGAGVTISSSELRDVMAKTRIREILDFIAEQRDSLADGPVRLQDIRDRMAAIEAFAGDTMLQRSLVGTIAGIVRHYYPLVQCIALYHREMSIYHEHIHRGDFDDTNYRKVRISSVYGLCVPWLTRNHRYAYGDVRLLRPYITELLTEAAGWSSLPVPSELEPRETRHEWLIESYQTLQTWHEQLAPGGALYPSEAHLAYVQGFEAFAEQLVWDGRNQEGITITNFPAPPEVCPADSWWCTRHLPTLP